MAYDFCQLTPDEGEFTFLYYKLIVNLIRLDIIQHYELQVGSYLQRNGSATLTMQTSRSVSAVLTQRMYIRLDGSILD